MPRPLARATGGGSSRRRTARAAERGSKAALAAQDAPVAALAAPAAGPRPNPRAWLRAAPAKRQGSEPSRRLVAECNKAHPRPLVAVHARRRP
eukprot:5291029-Pyramimonas_sp.AAC.1